MSVVVVTEGLITDLGQDGRQTAYVLMARGRNFSSIHEVYAAFPDDEIVFQLREKPAPKPGRDIAEGVDFPIF